MATSQWIDSAAREQKPAVGVALATGRHLLHTPTGTAEAEATERTDAIHMNRRLANRHHCTGLCNQPEHTRDVAAGHEVLEALGLIPYMYAPEDADTIRCNRCQERKPRAAFSSVSKRPTGRATTCKDCCADGRQNPQNSPATSQVTTTT